MIQNLVNFISHLQYKTPYARYNLNMKFINTIVRWEMQTVTCITIYTVQVLTIWALSVYPYTQKHAVLCMSSSTVYSVYIVL